ncbi:MAG: ribosome biogenesis factor YjgA [Casimicrobiaceae bacterium]
MAADRVDPDAMASGPAPVSKTRRKLAMIELQDLGEVLSQLSPARLAALALPERLVDAIGIARRLNRREARRRQMQYVGRLMRDIDPAPIEAQLAQWSAAPNAEKVRIAAVERWRARLLEGPVALDELCATAPRADRSRLSALVARSHEERARGSPPHAYRELFRELNALLSANA